MTRQTERVQTLADVRAVIDGNDRLDYQFTDREAAYEFIRRTLVRFDYPTRTHEASSCWPGPLSVPLARR